MKLSVIWPVHGLRIGDYLRVPGGELLRVHGVADSHAMVERDAEYALGDGRRLVGVVLTLVGRVHGQPTPAADVSVIPMRELQLWTLTDEAAQ